MKKNNITETFSLLWNENSEKAYQNLRTMRERKHFKRLENENKEVEKEKKQQRYKKALRYL